VAGTRAKEIADVYERLFQPIFRYCAYRLFSRTLAEDATSTAFVRMVEQWPVLRGRSEIELRNWLYGTASNAVSKVLRERRRERPQQACLLEQHAVKTDESPDEPSDLEDLSTLIGRLPQRDQELLVLRYGEDLSIDEISDIVGATATAVRVRLHRARSRLQQQIGDDALNLRLYGAGYAEPT
jgi:RNA polymerase sigma-70 factor (ECF subfamily)